MSILEKRMIPYSNSDQIHMNHRMNLLISETLYHNRLCLTQTPLLMSQNIHVFFVTHFQTKCEGLNIIKQACTVGNYSRR